MATITRSVLISLLHSMGIELPPGTKLSEPDLESRLIDALDASQSIRRILSPESTINPSSLNLISRDIFNGDKSLSAQMLYATTTGPQHIGETGAEALKNPFQELK
jgi:hypothetical protein